MTTQTLASTPFIRGQYHTKLLAFSIPIQFVRRPVFIHPQLQSTSFLIKKSRTYRNVIPLDRQVQCSAQPQHSGSNELKGSSSTNEPSTSSSPSTPSLPLSLGLLNLTTVLWGTQHAVIKLALNDMNPSTLNFARFALAAVVSVPALRPLARLERPWKAPVVRHGVELSIYLFAGYALQSAALLTTSASRSAFLLYLNVKLVPLFARLLYGRSIAVATWASAVLALFGTTLLTYDGAPPALGDAFSIAAAAASALFILRTEAAARAIDVTPSILNAVTLSSVAILMGVWTGVAAVSQFGLDLSLIASRFSPSTSNAATSVAYLAFVTTALCNYLQAVGQRGVSAERAAVVFAMDPVYGALFAWLLLGESLGTQGIFGALIILSAAVLSGFADAPGKKKETGKLNESAFDDDVKSKNSGDRLEKSELSMFKNFLGKSVDLKSSQASPTTSQRSKLQSGDPKLPKN